MFSQGILRLRVHRNEQLHYKYTVNLLIKKAFFTSQFSTLQISIAIVCSPSPGRIQ